MQQAGAMTSAALRDFRCTRFTFVLEALSPICFEEFCGATLRGGLGRILKELVCEWPPGKCPECHLRYSCAYGYLFETSPPPDSERLRNVENIPRPYVVDPLGGQPPRGTESRPVTPRATFVPGDRFHFDIVLVGRAIPYVTFLIVALDRLGRRGTGPARGRFRVCSVHAPGIDETICIYRDGIWLRDDFDSTPFANWVQDGHIPDATLRVEFLSPTRVTDQGRVQHEVEFAQLIRALLRRLSSLCYFHCGYELPLDFRDLIQRANAVQVRQSRLYWVHQKRISGRQRKPVFADGVVGDVLYRAADGQWDDFLPLLAAGQLVHVGKTCVMGAGKFQYQFVQP